MKQKFKGLLGTLIFALVVASALLVVQWYQVYSLTSSLREDAYVVATNEVSKNLLKLEVPEKSIYDLTKVPQGEPVFYRRNHYYVGQGKDEIDGSFPFYVNDANEIMIVDDSAILITDRFEEVETFKEMYVSDGLSFNYDKSQADDDTFLFLKLSNGLFMNAQGIHFSSITTDKLLRMNSIINFTKDMITFYYPSHENTLIYGQITDTKQLMVTIGDKTFSYEQLLAALNIKGGASTANVPEGEEGKNPDYIEEGTQYGENEGPMSEQELIELLIKDQENGIDPNAAEKAEGEKEGSKNEGETIPGQDGSGSEIETGGNEESESGEGTEDGEKSDEPGEGESSGGGSGSGTGEKGEEGDSGEESEESGLPEWTKPTVSFEDWVTDVYSASNSITLRDPSAVFRRVVVSLYWQPEDVKGEPKQESDNPNDYKIGFRKTYKSNGDFTVDNLPPDTWIYAKATIYYYGEDGKTKHEEIYDGFDQRFHTASLDTVDDIYVQLNTNPEDVAYHQHAISLYDFAVSGENKNVIDKIAKVRITLNEIDDNNILTGASYEIYMNLSDAKAHHFYPSDIENIPVWTSDPKQQYLPSNKKFEYKVELLDSFGSKFTRIVEGYRDNRSKDENKSLSQYDHSGNYDDLVGITWTAKSDPTVRINQRSFSDKSKNINRAAFEITVSDRDGAITNPENYVIKLFDETLNDYVSFAVSKDDEKNGNLINSVGLAEDDGNIILDTAKRYEFWGLTAGHVYRAEITGKYDINDRKGEKDLYASIRFSTVSMTSLGRVSYIFDSEHVKTNIAPDGTVLDELSKYESATAQKLTMQIDFSQISETDLIDLYYDRVEFSITKQPDSEILLKGEINKEAMQSIKISSETAGARNVEFEVNPSELFASDRNPVQTINGYLPKIFIRADGFTGEMTLWELFSSTAYNGTIVFYFEDALKETNPGTLESNTTYRIDTQSFAVQGALNEDHDITSRSSAYRRYNFTTLKRMPYVTISDALLVSDYIKFSGIKLHDYDHAIVDSRVNVDVTSFTVRKVNIDYSTVDNDNGGYIDELIYNYLTKGQPYSLSIAPECIKRSIDDYYDLYDEELYHYSFIAGSGLSGKITLASISFPLDSRDGSDSTAVELKSDYCLYDASNVAVGPGGIDVTMYPNDKDGISAGTVIDTGKFSSGNRVISPFISVHPGQYIYLTDLGDSASRDNYVMFYDDSGKVVTIDTNKWEGLSTPDTTNTGTGNQNTNRLAVYSERVLLKVPEHATQMRFSMYGTSTKSASVPSYAIANCYDMSKAGGVIELGEGGNNDPLTVKQANEKTTNGFPVAPGEVYAIPDAKNGIRITYYNGNDTIGSFNSYDNVTNVTKATSNSYAGQVFVVPANATSMKVTFEVASTNVKYTNINSAHLVKLDLQVLDWLNSKDLTRFANAVSISVYDPLNNLVNSPRNKNSNLSQVYLRISQNGTPLEETDYPLTEETVDNMGLNVVKTPDGTLATQNLMGYMCNFISDVNQTYNLELYVLYKNKDNQLEEIVLDSVEFKTFKALEIIDDRSDLGKLMRYPTADFLVVDDIFLRNNEQWYFGSETNPFLGTIDFQGYTLKASTNQSEGYLGMNTLGPSGVIKNMVLDFTINAMTNHTGMTYIRGISERNQGTMKNIVVKLNLGLGMYRKTSSAALTRYNSGLIENVTLELSGNSTNYVGGSFGGLVMDNSGNIHNVLAYSPISLSATTGVHMGSTTGNISNNYVGYLSSSGSGEVNNAIVVGNLAIEDFQPNGEIGYASLISGSRTQQVHNSVTVGDINKVVWNSDKTRSLSPYTDFGPSVAGTVAQIKQNTGNNYYFSPNGSVYNNTTKGYMQRIEEAALLQDPSIYNKTVNTEGDFVMSDVNEGFYPRINMGSEKLLAAQPHVPIASSSIDNTIRYLTAVVDEQYEAGETVNGVEVSEDYAIITLSFVNRLNRPISNLQIEGLKVSPVEGTTYEQKSVDGQYKVTVKVSPDNMFRRQYSIKSFNYNEIYVNEVVDREVNVKFSKPVTQDNWIDQNGKSFMDDPAGCYRLASDIDMDKYESKALKTFASKAMNTNLSFTGEFDGRGLSLKNFAFESNPYLIRATSGAEIMNLRVENMTINNTGVKYSNVGLIGLTDNGTKIHDVQIVNANVIGVSNNGGALVGKVARTDVYDCVVNGLTMNTSSVANTVSIGGLTGYVTTSNIDNCFAKNIDIQVKEGSDIQGTGGLVGYMGSASYIRNVYTHGSIESNFIRTGGIIGFNNGFVINSWSKVNVSSTSQYIGGISGIQESSSRLSNTLALGDVFTTTSDTSFNRINGGFYSTPTAVARAYASSEQVINSQVTDKLYDAVGLLTKENLKSIQVYYNTANIGELFCYDYKDENVDIGINKGYLPILYNKAGEKILPEQTDGILAVPDKLEFTAEGTMEYTIKNIKTNDSWSGHDDHVYSQTDSDTWENAYDAYKLSVTLAFDTEKISLNKDNYDDYYKNVFGENYNNIIIENLDLTGIEPTHEFKDGKMYLSFDDVKATKYMDSYRVVIDTPNGKEAASLSFKDDDNKDAVLYHHIFRVHRNQEIADMSDGYDRNCWVDLMALYGNNYDNFMVMADLDFSELTKSNLQLDLKIGRLEGSIKEAFGAVDFDNHKMGYDYLCEEIEESTISRYWKLQHLNYSETSKQGLNWFNDIQSSLSRLEFSDINWTSTASGQHAAVIRKMTGTMSYVDIQNLKIDYGYSTGYIGFIDTNVGNIEYVRGRNIKVVSNLQKPNDSIPYVGGIVAYSNSMVENVHIRGTLTDSNDVRTSGYHIQGQYITSSKTNNSHNGGIAGQLAGTGGRYLYAENIYVTGNYYVGALAGYNYNYNSTYTKYGTADHNTDQIGVGENEDPIMLGKATNCHVEGSYYVGALYGFSGYQKYLLGRDNYVKGYQGVGGLSGHSYGTSYSQVYDTYVEATNNRAGGIAAHGMSSTTSSYNVVQGCNIHAPVNAGGISGSTSTINQGYSVVKDSAIYSEENAGGIAAEWSGNSSNYASYYNLVTRSIIGRTSSTRPQVVKNSDGTYEFNMVPEVGSATNYVGGLYGQSYGMYFYQDVVDDSVKIYGNDYVGGLYGRGGAGSSYRLEIAPDIQASGSYVGTLAGELVGYAEAAAGPNILSKPVTKFEKLILSGNVEGRSSVGAFVGRFNVGNRPQDPDTGAYLSDEDTGYTPYMNRDFFKKILLAQGTVNATGSSSNLGVIASNIKQSSTEGIDYLYIFADMNIAGTHIKDLNASTYMSEGNIVSYRRNDNVNVINPRLVNMDDMQSAYLYYDELTSNGLYLSETNANNSNYYRYFDTQENGASPSNKTDAVHGVLKDGRFPYLDIGGGRTHVGGVDQDGIAMPSNAAGASFMMMAMYDPEEIYSQVSIYASGADTLNIEMPEMLFDRYPMAKYSIYDSLGRNIVKDEKVESRVLTLPYDYSTMFSFELTLEDGENKIYAVSPEMVANSVMLYGDHAYFIKSDGIYADDGAGNDPVRVLSGDFVHMYQGKVTDSDGKVYGIGGSRVGSVVSVGAPLSKSVPLFTTNYDSIKLDAYKNYTVRNSVSMPVRMFTKSGQLFMADPSLDQENGENFTSFIADYYASGNVQYYSTLSSGHTLDNYMTAIKWPEKVNNSSIMAIADNINANVPYALIRYYDNTVACFNYQTGTLIFTDNSEKMNLTFGQFATMWLDGFTNNLSTNNAYLSAVDLIGDIASNPVDNSLLAGVVSGEGATTTGAENAELSGLVINGTSTEVGKPTEGLTPFRPDEDVTEMTSTSENSVGGVSEENEEEVSYSSSVDKPSVSTATADGKQNNTEAIVPNAEGDKKEDETVKFPSENSKDAYITMATGNGYVVYKIEDLLNSKGGKVLSMNEKIELLKTLGLYSSFDLQSLKIESKSQATGVALVSVAVVTIFALIGVLYYRKKVMSKY